MVIVLCIADFSGEQVVQRHMSRLGRELLYHRIEAASGTDDRKALDLVLQEYGVLHSRSASLYSLALCLYPAKVPRVTAGV